MSFLYLDSRIILKSFLPVNLKCHPGNYRTPNSAPVHNCLRDSLLKGYGIRVLSSGAKHYFVHTQPSSASFLVTTVLKCEEMFFQPRRQFFSLGDRLA